jgi:hypothetical protein
MNQKKITEVLGDWLALLAFIRTCTEDEAAALLKAEREGACRRTMLLRIHQRYNVLRGRRERDDLGRLGMRSR